MKLRELQRYACTHTIADMAQQYVSFILEHYPTDEVIRILAEQIGSGKSGLAIATMLESEMNEKGCSLRGSIEEEQ